MFLMYTQKRLALMYILKGITVANMSMRETQKAKPVAIIDA